MSFEGLLTDRSILLQFFYLLWDVLSSSIADDFARLYKSTSHIKNTILGLIKLSGPLPTKDGSHLFIFDVLVKVPCGDFSLVLPFP